MATEIITSFLQLSNSAGTPMSGAKVYVYDVETTTPRDIFSDTGLGTPAANPIICDSAGRHGMRYTAAGSYKIVVKTSADVTVYTSDNIDGRIPIGSGALAIANGGTGATTAVTALSNLGAATSAEVAVIAAQLATLAGTLTSVEKTHIATGTTAQRPAGPVEGDIRRNTSTSLYEGYTTTWENFATYTKSNTFPTIQRFTTAGAATYTTPSGVKYIRVRMVGGGGGGGAVVTNNGTNGTNSVFESWTAVLGQGGVAGTTSTGGTGGTGGAAGTGTLVTRVAGQTGQGGGSTAVASTPQGGIGGSSFFGGGGTNGYNSAAGGAAATNSGSGGSGAANGASTSGGGGGAGEYVEFLINAPSASYSYTVGAKGTGGAAGTKAGGDGADGQIIVEEYYV